MRRVRCIRRLHPVRATRCSVAGKRRTVLHPPEPRAEGILGQWHPLDELRVQRVELVLTVTVHEQRHRHGEAEGMLSAIAIKSLSGRRGTALIGALLPPYQLITARSLDRTSAEAITTSGLSCFRDSSFRFRWRCCLRVTASTRARWPILSAVGLRGTPLRSPSRTVDKGSRDDP